VDRLGSTTGKVAEVDASVDSSAGDNAVIVAVAPPNAGSEPLTAPVFIMTGHNAEQPPQGRRYSRLELLLLKPPM
jgi:hypothetical protein